MKHKKSQDFGKNTNTLCVWPDSQNMKVGLGCMAKSGKYNHLIWLELRALEPFLQG